MASSSVIAPALAGAVPLPCAAPATPVTAPGAPFAGAPPEAAGVPPGVPTTGWASKGALGGCVSVPPWGRARGRLLLPPVCAPAAGWVAEGACGNAEAGWAPGDPGVPPCTGAARSPREGVDPVEAPLPVAVPGALDFALGCTAEGVWPATPPGCAPGVLDGLPGTPGGAPVFAPAFAGAVGAAFAGADGDSAPLGAVLCACRAIAPLSSPVDSQTYLKPIREQHSCRN